MMLLWLAAGWVGDFLSMFSGSTEDMNFKSSCK